MNYQQIELQATNLQKFIWKNRKHLWPEKLPLPVEMIKPEIAAHILGLDYCYSQELAHHRFTFRGQKFKTAGMLDRQRNTIVISNDTQEIMDFTGSHEIGHWLLHPKEIMHRDRPINKIYNRNDNRPKIEKEADYFAACFLMPPNLLKDYFTDYFQCESQFTFNENTAFNLETSNFHSLLNTPKDSLDRELTLAKCTTYNGQHFKSLAETFGVSNTAMAIRLKELQLIRWP